jgi:hypothetical protein
MTIEKYAILKTKDAPVDGGAREQLGDRNAPYHAQEPKVRAYKLLIDCGFGPKQAIKIFDSYCKKMAP